MSMYQVFQRCGIRAEGITLAEAAEKPDIYMFREAIMQVTRLLEPAGHAWANPANYLG
jgi:hypothetical protein